MTSTTFESGQSESGFRHNKFKRRAGFAGRNVLLAAMVTGGMFLAGCSSKEEDQPAGQAGHSDGPKLLQYVDDGFFAAVVVHPARLLKSPLIPKQPLDELLNSPENISPLKPQDVEEIAMFFSLPAMGPESKPEKNFGLVISLNTSITTEKLLEALPDTPVKAVIGEATHDGKTYVTVKVPTSGRSSRSFGPGGGEDSGAEIATSFFQIGIFRPDDQTLVIAEESTLKKMLSASGANSPLAQKLANLDLNNDLAIVVSIEQEREAIREIVENAPMDVPPNVATLPDSLNTITITADLTSGSLLNVSLEGANEDAAAELEKSAGQVKQMLGGMFGFLKLSAGQEGGPKISPALLAVIENIIKGVSVTRDGNAVVVDVKNPGDLGKVGDELFDAIKSAMEGGNQRPPSGPGGPEPGSALGPPADGNSEKTEDKVEDKKPE